MMRKRVFAIPSPCLDAICAAEQLDIVVRVYRKFDVLVLASSRRIMRVILMDREGNMMFAVICGQQIDRLDPSIIEGRVYFLEHVDVRPITIESEFLDNPFECVFSAQTVASQLMDLGEIPRFPRFVPFRQVFNRIGRSILVDVIGVVTTCSRMTHDDSYNGGVKRDVCLLDQHLCVLTLSVTNDLVTAHVQNWWGCQRNITVLVATMLRVEGPILRTTEHSRVYFNPDIDEATNLRSRFTGRL